MTTLAPASPPRLTSLAHGGGCGCKIAPGVLSQILRQSSGFPLPKELLVGIETSDDAAVYQLNDAQALVATTDFFMPIVDDPRDFGRIAATNAISDVYAMGGTPIFALALVGMPVNVLAQLDGVHALTDVTGFGLAGHTLELARGAKVRAHIDWARVPLLAGVRELAERGLVTGASGRNWAAHRAQVTLPANCSDTEIALLNDPQTSGGLLVSCRADAVDQVLDIFRRLGFAQAAVIGEMSEGPVGLTLR